MQNMLIRTWYISAIMLTSITLPFLSHAGISGDTVKTLLGSSKLRTLGLVISPEIGGTTYASSFTSVAGMGASLIFNNRFSMGVAVSSTLDKEFTPTALDPNKQLHLTAQQGAVRCEYTFSAAKLLHLSIPLTAGIGRIQVDSLQERSKQNFHDGFGGRGGFRQGQRTGFVQPAIHAELNIAKYIRFFAGIGYRITVFNDTNNAENALTTAQLNGLSLQAGLKLGFFDISVRKKRVD